MVTLPPPSVGFANPWQWRLRTDKRYQLYSDQTLYRLPWTMGDACQIGAIWERKYESWGLALFNSRLLSYGAERFDSHAILCRRRTALSASPGDIYDVNKFLHQLFGAHRWSLTEDPKSEYYYLGE